MLPLLMSQLLSPDLHSRFNLRATEAQELHYKCSLTIWVCKRRCALCNSYLGRKWNMQSKFKSRTRRFTFHFMLTLFCSKPNDTVMFSASAHYIRWYVIVKSHPYLLISIVFIYWFLNPVPGAVEYANCISTEREDPTPVSVQDMTFICVVVFR